MAKIMQHNMIKLKKGEFHPIFRFAYLPENLASLLETVVFLIEWLFIIIVATNLAIVAFPKYAPDHIITNILSFMSTRFFSSIGVANSTASNIVALLVLVFAYFQTHKYFENVKYNLHVERNSNKSNKE